MKFNQLSLIPPLLRAVVDAGYQTPSPIQEKAIPPVLAGQDLLACAQTGTGKTAAFALPILQLLAARTSVGPKAIRTLVLTPTRELALQIQESFALYGKYLKLSSTVIFGGVSQNPQVTQLRRGVDILVATPGRLNDLIGQGHIKLDKVEVFVLDEADRMLDMGFVQDVKKILRLLPEKKQTLLFSATMPNEIVKLADNMLNKPAKVFVTPVSSTVDTIDQTIYRVDKANKRLLLAHILKDDAVASALVFTRTKHGADRVVRELSRENVQALAIHGNKSQNARQDALARFKDGRVKVLVATDIAARGLDINELSHVINYDLPNIPETYVHRIGRTGRAGHGGTAISFSNFDELEYLTDIEKLIGFKIKEITAHAWPMEVLEKSPPKQQGRGGQNPRGGQGARPAQSPSAKQPAQQKKTKIPTAPQKKQTPLIAPAQSAIPARGAQQSPRPRRVETAAEQSRPASPSPAGARPTGNKNPRGKSRKGPFPPYDPYENLTGGKSIVTKRPIWADDAPVAQPSPVPPQKKTEGGQDMSRNNRNRGGKNRANNRPKDAAPAPASIPTLVTPPPTTTKTPGGVYNFSEAELAQDEAIKVISRTSTETKYANFEDFLKDH